MARDYTVLNTGKGTTPSVELITRTRTPANSGASRVSSPAIGRPLLTLARSLMAIASPVPMRLASASGSPLRSGTRLQQLPSSKISKEGREAGLELHPDHGFNPHPEVEVTRVDSADGRSFFSQSENEFNLLDELTDIYSALAPLYYGEVLKRALDGEPIFWLRVRPPLMLSSVGLNGTTLNKNAPKETLKAALIDRGVHASQIVVCPDQDKVGVKDSQKVAEVIPGCRFMNAFLGLPSGTARCLMVVAWMLLTGLSRVQPLRTSCPTWSMTLFRSAAKGSQTSSNDQHN